jgi:hypothetical protein
MTLPLLSSSSKGVVIFGFVLSEPDLNRFVDILKRPSNAEREFALPRESSCPISMSKSNVPDTLSITVLVAVHPKTVKLDRKIPLAVESREESTTDMSKASSSHFGGLLTSWNHTQKQSKNNQSNTHTIGQKKGGRAPHHFVQCKPTTTTTTTTTTKTTTKTAATTTTTTTITTTITTTVTTTTRLDEARQDNKCKL